MSSTNDIEKKIAEIRRQLKEKKSEETTAKEEPKKEPKNEVTEEEMPTYGYQKDVQTKFAALLLTEMVSLEEFIELVKPEFWDNPELQDIVRIIIEFYKKYKRKPDLSEVESEMTELLLKDKRKAELLDEYTENFKNIWGMACMPESMTWARDKMIDFLKYQAMRKILLESRDSLKKREYKKIIESLQSVEKIGEDGGLRTISFDQIKPEEIQWLWQNRFPHRKYSLIVGDGDVGKTFLSIYLAAHVTTGESWPDTEQTIEKGEVLILTAEDGLADTVRKRLDWLGADVTKVHTIDSLGLKGESESFDLTKDIPRLEKFMKKHKNILLLIIDPMSAYTPPGKYDPHKDAHVRSMLKPLCELAEKYEFAVIGILHLNKNKALDAIHRPGMSIGWVNAARSTWLILKDKSDPEQERRFLCKLKFNIGKPGRDLLFRIVSAPNNEARIVFEDEQIFIDVESLLKEETGKPIIRATQFLREKLADGAVIWAQEIYDDAESEGIKKRTLDTAKKNLKIESELVYDDEGERKWYWKLPESKIVK